MADIPTQPPTSPVPESDPNWWCYHCNKRVSVETLTEDNVICFDCKHGFVEHLSTPDHGPEEYDALSFGDSFIHVLRLLADEARPFDAPLEDLDIFPPVEEEEDEEGEGDDGDDQSDEVPEIDEDELRSRRRDALQLRISGNAGRLIDWDEIMMRFELPGFDRYIGNPEDYVDSVGYTAVLQNLAEDDSAGRRGAPPAAKSVVEGLLKEKVEWDKEVVECVVCKDVVGVGGIVTKLPCGHGYHGDCIVPWLRERNTCPVCRLELPTDDAEYEEERIRMSPGSGRGSSSSG